MDKARVISIGVTLTVLCAFPGLAKTQDESNTQAGRPLGTGAAGIKETLSRISGGNFVNEFTGQVAFPVSLGGVANHHGLRYALSLGYFGGGADIPIKTHSKFLTPSWVGAGFALGGPFVATVGPGTEIRNQKYFISFDGVSQQELVPTGVANEYVAKNDPFTKVVRAMDALAGNLVDQCSYPANASSPVLSAFIDYWVATLPNGTKLTFGDPDGFCDDTNYELCEPAIQGTIAYRPFYGTQPKFPRVHYLQKMVDRRGKFAIWLDYDKMPHQDTLTGQCNVLNTTAVLGKVDRALYLKEIYSTNGVGKADFKTSRIILTNSAKTEEAVYSPVLEEPGGFLERRKLTKVDFMENGYLTHELNFEYQSASNRMRLWKITKKEPKLQTSRPFLTLTYEGPSGLAIKSLEDAQGGLVEFSYQKIQADTATGISFDFQDLEFPDPYPDDGIAFPYPDMRVVLARQIGNRFYVQLESRANGCAGSGAPRWEERLYEYEHNGTYWRLKRTLKAPGRGCADAFDFYLSPDGKYCIWLAQLTLGFGNITIHDLTTEDAEPPTVGTFNYTGADVNVFTYPGWFAVQPTAETWVFYYQNASGAWISSQTSCPPDIAAATYNTTSDRSANYSGENEGISGCLTFSHPTRAYPGPNFLAVINRHYDILHVFANNNGIKDYVKGLEATTPALPNFTSQDVGDDDLWPMKRPWFRYDSDGNPNTPTPWHNNWQRDMDIISVSENLIVTLSGTDKDIWKYLYVLGWDGNKLRYLHDEPILADWDDADELEIEAGSDYFILKNLYVHPGDDRSGFWFYKADLKEWKVSKQKLTIPSPLGTPSQSDWAIRADRDYFTLEKMENGSKGVAFSPAYVRDGEPDHYHNMGMSSVFMLGQDRNPIDITNELKLYLSTGGHPVNLTVARDRLLIVDYKRNPWDGKYAAAKYVQVKRMASDAALNRFETVSIPASSETGIYQTARLVAHGTMVFTHSRPSMFSNVNSLTGMRFYPDPFGKIELTPGGTKRHGAKVVASVKIKSKGPESTGSNLQTVTYTYPDASPENVASARLKNHAAGQMNFKHVRKEFAEGAVVSAFVRDELASPLPQGDRNMIGAIVKTWALPDKTNSNWTKPGGRVGTTQLSSTASAFQGVFSVRNLGGTTKDYFHSSYIEGIQHYADFDAKNGQPKVSVAKSGDKRVVNLQIMQHDLDPSVPFPFDKVRQTVTLQFPASEAPCTAPEPTPCSNISLAWIDASTSRKQRIVSSTITRYDADGLPDAVFTWKPSAPLGTIYPNLNADPTASGSGWKWVQLNGVVRRQNHAIARCQGDMVNESEESGVRTTHFFGGDRCQLLGTVKNSGLFSSALLTGEEDIRSENCQTPGACFGAFGRWETVGSTIQSVVAHTGRKSIKVTAQYGPTINLKLREQPGFIDRKKGFIVSAWVYAEPSANPAFVVEKRTSAGTYVAGIDLVQEYAPPPGSFPVHRWVKLERQVTYDELVAGGTFAASPSQDYLRIWIGKSSSSSGAVYVDDVRLYPADAIFATTNYDEIGLVSSTLDGNNDPSFMVYDAWKNLTAVRRKDGLVFSTAAAKLFNE